MSYDQSQIVLTFEFEQGKTDIPTFVYLDENLDRQELQLLNMENLCPPAIPTLSTWMIIMLSLIMATAGLVFVIRREVRTFLGLL